MSLFQNIDFTSHSGVPLTWKIECDALTPDDWAWAAARVAERVSFHSIVGIPTGGWRFGDALEQYKRDDGHYFLLADDVLTTGRSFREWHEILATNAHPIRPNFLGVVLFARIPPPEPWIKALFIMPEWS